jgi:hypothetical protein
VTQALFQAFGLLAVLAFALIGGSLTGLVLKASDKRGFQDEAPVSPHKSLNF